MGWKNKLSDVIHFRVWVVPNNLVSAIIQLDPAKIREAHPAGLVFHPDPSLLTGTRITNPYTIYKFYDWRSFKISKKFRYCIWSKYPKNLDTAYGGCD